MWLEQAANHSTQHNIRQQEVESPTVSIRFCTTTNSAKCETNSGDCAVLCVHNKHLPDRAENSPCLPSISNRCIHPPCSSSSSSTTFIRFLKSPSTTLTTVWHCYSGHHNSPVNTTQSQPAHTTTYTGHQQRRLIWQLTFHVTGSAGLLCHAELSQTAPSYHCA